MEQELVAFKDTEENIDILVAYSVHRWKNLYFGFTQIFSTYEKSFGKDGDNPHVNYPFSCYLKYTFLNQLKISHKS